MIQSIVATITLNRPERLNAYTAALGAALRAAVRQASDDPQVRCIVLTGAGRDVCAGADEALRLGVVDRVVPADPLMAAVRAYALDLADNVSPRSMAVIKRQLWAVSGQSLREVVDIGDREMRASFATADFKKRVAHFVEKRPARFTGR